MEKQIHHGELIKEIMKKKGIKASWLAEQIPYSKINIYRFLDKACIDCITLRKISKILDYDLCG
jgi:hypothetical protein